MVIENPLPRSVLIVAVFWWIVCTILAVQWHPYLFTTSAGWSAVVRFITIGLIGGALGVVFGLASVLYARLVRRLERHESLKGTSNLGMLCTLGDMPVRAPVTLKVGGEIPAWFFDPQYIQYGPELKQWFDAANLKYPAHARALAACIRVLCQFPNLPASHVPNGHGGKTLVDHSARVAALAMKEAKTFRYAGLVTKFGNEPWGDAGYDFVSTDPMIPLIGFAHDIGKLSTFTLDANQKVTSSRPGHDMIGSRLLATMDEIKALPSADQAALHRAISFYHHPSAYPLNKEGRIGDDRSVALMMLLIRADKRAGKEEAGNSLTPEQYAAYLAYMRDLGQELDTQEQEVLASVGAHTATITSGTRRISDEEMRAAILKVLTDPTQLLTHNPEKKEFKNAVGQLNNTSYPQWAWDWKASGDEFDADAVERLQAAMERLIVLNEPKFRIAIGKRLGLSEFPKKGDGRYLLTIHALRVMYDMGVLYTDATHGNISPESALYVVQIQRNTDGSELASWRGAIVLRPVNDLSRYATGAVHPSMVKIVRPMWKDRKVSVDGDAVEETVEYAPDEVLDEAPGDVPIDDGVTADASAADSQVEDTQQESDPAMQSTLDKPVQTLPESTFELTSPTPQDLQAQYEQARRESLVRAEKAAVAPVVPAERDTRTMEIDLQPPGPVTPSAPGATQADADDVPVSAADAAMANLIASNKAVPKSPSSSPKRASYDPWRGRK